MGRFEDEMLKAIREGKLKINMDEEIKFTKERAMAARRADRFKKGLG